MKLNARLAAYIGSLLFASLAIVPLQSSEARQADVQLIQQRQAVVENPQSEQDSEKDSEKKTPEDEIDQEVTDTKSIPNTAPQVPNNYVRFHMWDGSIVAGEVEVDVLSIETEFGVLQVPIQRIQKLFPGLDSFPELKSKIEMLVEGLGDKDFDTREKSHRELASMGMQIRHEVDRFKDGGSAERKKRLAAIKQEIEESLDELEDDGSLAERSLIRGDAVETPEFAIVGKILQNKFDIKSKFGQLTVNLSDIKMAERPVAEIRDTIKKSVAVGAEKFFQRQPVSTRIRVNKGDKISIKADGVVQWTNWSSSSSPDGLNNQGQYQGIQSGALCARIGSNGKILKVGSKNDWTAKQSGVLYLGIAMQDNYLNQNGYRWTGEYNAKVQVKPAESE